jgi:hypothetical protein
MTPDEGDDAVVAGVILRPIRVSKAARRGNAHPPANATRPAERHDYECKRNGTAKLFMLFATRVGAS